MKTNIRVRRASKKDLDILAKLDLGYCKYENSLDKRIEIPKIKELRKANEKYMKLGTLYFIAEENKTPLGYISINFCLQGRENTGVLHTLFVDEKARGRGIGNMLVQHVFDLFKKNKCTRVRSFMHIANKNAQAFWRKHGFELEEGYTASKRMK